MFDAREFNAFNVRSNGSLFNVINNVSVSDVSNNMSVFDVSNNVSAFDVTNNVFVFDVSNNVSVFDVINNVSVFDVSNNVSAFDVINNVSVFDVSYNVSAFDVSNNASVFDISNNVSWTSNKTRDCINNCFQALTPEITKVLVAMEKYFYLPLIIFGIVTNVLTLLTLRSSRLKESPYVYLTALVAADLMALLLIWVENIIDLNPDNFAYTIYRIRVYYPLNNIAITVGLNIMMVLTIERCVFVKYPLWARFKCTVHRAKVHTGIIIMLSLLVNLPRFFWYQIVTCHEDKAILVSAEYIYPDIAPILAWVNTVVHKFIPFLVMILLNPFMVYKVRIHQKKRGMLGVRSISNVHVWSREQLRLTTISIVIIFLFVVLVLPSAFADNPILRPLMGYLFHTDQRLVYQIISNTLMLLNISGNFIMFSFINSKFLKAFREMLAGWRLGLDRFCTRERRQVKRFGFHEVLKRQSSQAISLQLESSLSSQPKA